MGKHFIYHLILFVREDGKAFVWGTKRANNINFGVTRSLSWRERERRKARENFLNLFNSYGAW